MIDYHALSCLGNVQDLSIRRHEDVRNIIFNVIEKQLPLTVVNKELLNRYNAENPAANKKPDVSFSHRAGPG